MQSDIDEKVTPQQEKRFSSSTVVVGPGKVKRVGLGAYTKSEHQPEFNLIFEPAMKDMLDVTLEQLDIPGKSKYLLLYQIRNVGHESCRITVERRTA